MIRVEVLRRQRELPIILLDFLPWHSILNEMRIQIEQTCVVPLDVFITYQVDGHVVFASH